MAFENRNNLGSKSRLFDNALRRAIAQDDGKRLRDAAEKLLSEAANGEPWAIGMLADRLDGRAVQNSNVTFTDERAEELADNDLLRIASAGRDGTAQAPSGAKKSSELH